MIPDSDSWSRSSGHFALQTSLVVVAEESLVVAPPQHLDSEHLQPKLAAQKISDMLDKQEEAELDMVEELMVEKGRMVDLKKSIETQFIIDCYYYLDILLPFYPDYLCQAVK